MKRFVAYVLSASVLALSCTGCSIFRSNTQEISITASPHDTVLMVNGTTVMAPAKIYVRRDQPLTIQGSKAGYYNYVNNVGHSMNFTGVLDTIGIFIFLVPGLGLFSAGAWSLDQTQFHVELQPVK